MEKDLERLENLDIIEKVTGLAPWLSPIAVVQKCSGQVRFCVDMRKVHKVVKREKHIMPTIDDLVADLNGATVFCQLDLSTGYHQLELEQESRQITTFSSHVGLRRYKRLMFGINATSENLPYFQKRRTLNRSGENRGDHEHQRTKGCERNQVVTRNGPVRFTLHPRLCYDHSFVTSSYQGDTLAVARRTATCVWQTSRQSD